MFKEGHPQLNNNNNKYGSLGRLNNFVRKLNQNKQFEKHDSIKEQLDSKIIEKVDKKFVYQGNKYFMPHKTGVRETVQTIEVRVVYDASAKSYQSNI